MKKEILDKTEEIIEKSLNGILCELDEATDPDYSESVKIALAVRETALDEEDLEIEDEEPKEDLQMNEEKRENFRQKLKEALLKKMAELEAAKEAAKNEQ